MNVPALDVHTELGSDHGRAPSTLQGVANKLFVGVGPIHFGRVQEVQAEIKYVMDCRDRLSLVDPTVVEPEAHAHAAEPQCRNFEPLISEFPLM